jgi:predicted enzyme related to lactoylglutathione lyase
MIRGIHGLFYSSDPDETRNFFRDKVKLPGSDIGGGWWIFDFAEGDLGVHPVDPGAPGGKHDISFYCDDIHGTVAGMKARGVTFTKDVADHGYGLVTYFSAPGGITVQLYEPRYAKGTSRPAAKKAATKKAKPAKAASKTRAKAKPQAKPNGRAEAKPNGKAKPAKSRR